MKFIAKFIAAEDFVMTNVETREDVTFGAGTWNLERVLNPDDPAGRGDMPWYGISTKYRTVGLPASIFETWEDSSETAPFRFDRE